MEKYSETFKCSNFEILQRMLTYEKVRFGVEVRRLNDKEVVVEGPNTKTIQHIIKCIRKLFEDVEE